MTASWLLTSNLALGAARWRRSVGYYSRPP
jgi:hypothetical protein